MARVRIVSAARRPSHYNAGFASALFFSVEHEPSSICPRPPTNRHSEPAFFAADEHLTEKWGQRELLHLDDC